MREADVTGVQPWLFGSIFLGSGGKHAEARTAGGHEVADHKRVGVVLVDTLAVLEARAADALSEIGRASCRERGEISGVAVSLKKKRATLVEVCAYEK